MSLVAKEFRIFILTEANDDKDTNFIKFNNSADSNFKDTTKDGAYILTLHRGDPEGIGNNQAAEVDDGNVQPLGIVEGTYIIKGFISNMRGTVTTTIKSGRKVKVDQPNVIITKLRIWKNGAQVLNDVWEAGRFGIVDESDVDNSLTPIGTGVAAIGLIFENFSKVNDYNRNRVDITLTFRRSRGISI